MKNILSLLFFIAVSYKATAQITYIPDPAFEQALIDLEIDSDGVINGQVLTSDIENIVELEIFGYDYYGLSDLTGIQDFASLELLSINFSEITELDVSQNLQLKELNCGNNWLSEIDVSSNTLLEILYIGNYDGDVGPFNMIEEINLSNNPNLHTLNAQDMFEFKRINLKNGNNNADMSIDIGLYPWGLDDDPNYDPNEIFKTVCIEVDDENLAQNNQNPYSEWNISDAHVAVHFTDNAVQCSLNTQSFVQSNIKVYPNPVSDILYFESDKMIEKIILFDISGRKVLEQNQVNTISVSHLQKESYILKLFTDKGVQTEKIIVK